MESKYKALAIANAASDIKALDIVIVNMRRMPSVCNYFVIASGTSTTQVNAIADNIEKKLREKGQKLRHSEGKREALWVLLDYGDVVAHVFLDETRRYYNLERLWGGAPQIRFKETGRKVKISRTRKKHKKSTKARTKRNPS